MDAMILSKLADNGGAILGWQAEPAEAFADALNRGVILFDADSDCYVHPKAREVVAGGYEMTE